MNQDGTFYCYVQVLSGDPDIGEQDWNTNDLGEYMFYNNNNV